MRKKFKISSKYFVQCIQQLLLFWLILNLVMRSRTTTMGQNFMCLDEMTDFKNGGWRTYPQNVEYEYAESERDLTDLNEYFGDLEGRGIFWFEGGQNSNQWFLTRKFHKSEPNTVSYMYVKYYGHIWSNSRIFAYPGKGESGDLDLFWKLQNSTDYIWKEQIIHLDMKEGSAIGVKTLGLKYGEYFLLDKIIILNVPPTGEPPTVEPPTLQDFEALCPSPPQPLQQSQKKAPKFSRPSSPISPKQRPIFPPDTVDCIDGMAKFNLTDWRIQPESIFKYVESSDDLPEPLNEKMKGHGIFYAGGPDDPADPTPFLQFTDFSGKLPMFLYLRYYIHRGSTERSKGVMVTPIALEWTRPHFLEINETFQWIDLLLEIDGVKGADLGVEIAVLQFDPGDYFLIDEIVLTQGYPVTELWQIKGLCEAITTTEGDPDTPTTTTTTTNDPSTLTSTSSDPVSTTTPTSGTTEQSSVSDSTTMNESGLESGGLDVSTILLIFVAVSALLLFFQWGLRKILRDRRGESRPRSLSNADVSDFQFGRDYLDPKDLHAPIYSLPYNERLEISRDNLELNEMHPIGVGQFGIVLKGLLTREDGSQDLVAVKTVRSNVDVETFKALLAEIKIMSYLGRHENIAFLIGACTTSIKKLQVMAVVEFCDGGDLLHFLRKKAFVKFSAPTSSKNYVQLAEPNSFLMPDLLRFCLGIANGMIYLTEMNVIHGDLAARNILLTSSGDKMEVKISDFGLSRQLLNYPIYQKKQQSKSYLPLMWMPIESIKNGHFSIKSDVWSFGVVLWEIFSWGDDPASHFMGGNNNFLMDLEEGKRLEEPEMAGETLYEMMQECWQKEPDARPSFAQLHAQLTGMMAEMAPDGQNGTYCGGRMESVDVVLITSDYASQDEAYEQLLRPRRSVSSLVSLSSMSTLT